MNFKDFYENSKNNAYTDTSSKVNNTNNNETMNKSIEEKLTEYSSLSQDELLKEYIKQSNLVKQKGGYNQEQIDTIKSTLSPMLNEEQNNLLNNLIDMVK